MSDVRKHRPIQPVRVRQHRPRAGQERSSGGVWKSLTGSGLVMVRRQAASLRVSTSLLMATPLLALRAGNLIRRGRAFRTSVLGPPTFTSNGASPKASQSGRAGQVTFPVLVRGNDTRGSVRIGLNNHPAAAAARDPNFQHRFRIPQPHTPALGSKHLCQRMRHANCIIAADIGHLCC